jgi:hypothetical protein
MAPRLKCAWMLVLAVTAVTTSGTAADVASFRVRIAGSRHAQSLQLALAGAHERLGRPECRRLFSDYADEKGHPLQERLDTFGFSGQEFLRYIGFYEGYGHRRCGQTQVLAFTQPGSLAVRVCPQIAKQDREVVELVLIHELLHSLGLGENPPSSAEITRQVTRRCGGREDATVLAATR